MIIFVLNSSIIKYYNISGGLYIQSFPFLKKMSKLRFLKMINFQKGCDKYTTYLSHPSRKIIAFKILKFLRIGQV